MTAQIPTGALSAHQLANQPGGVLKAVARRTLQYDFSVWFWGDAIAMDGLLEAAELLGDTSYSDFCLKYFQRWSQRVLSWPDHLTPGAALLRLYERTHHRSLLDAAIRLAEWIAHVPKAPGLDVQLYRPDLPAYRHTVWVDTLYHEPPFFSLLARVTGAGEYDQYGLAIWNSHVTSLSSTRGPFLAHAFDTGARRLRGYGWGRGNGWALLGMADTLELLPEDQAGCAGATEDFVRLAEAVRNAQDPSGFWRTLLPEREVYLEASTAAFFGAAFVKGIRLGLLGHEFEEAAERAWHAMLNNIDEDGGFFGVSACTHVAVDPGDDVALYRTLPTDVNVWGQGAALRFAAERIRAGLP
ncbi:MAG: glycoside hydrolase family 88 protein [Bryobacteraceae bacterium]